MPHLDGSFGEGGGSLLRTALALSTYTGKPFSIDKIRQGRKHPGVKAQHLTAIKALKELCNAKTTPVKLGTSSLEFIPGKLKGGSFLFDIGTAGSISLLLQSLILPLLFGKKKASLTIKGGTCGKWQPPVTYLMEVLLPQLRKYGMLTMAIKKHGYYPKGQGEVHATLTPGEGNKPIMLTEQGHVKVMDFGLAKRVATSDTSEQDLTSNLTQEGATIGTLAYMSPEQLKAQQVDHRSDIFSLGIVFFEMLTGVHPFLRKQAVGTMTAILHDEPPPLSDYMPQPPSVLQKLIARSLAKDPADRFQTVDDLARQLNRIQLG